jgi:hypothetical protein
MKSYPRSCLGPSGGAAVVEVDTNGVTLWGRPAYTDVEVSRRRGCFLTKEEAQNLVLLLCEKWGFKP